MTSSICRVSRRQCEFSVNTALTSMSDRVALVTGAARGIGYATARRLAESGHHLVLHAHGPDSVASVGAELAEKYGVTVVTASGDIADPETSKQVMRVAFENFRRLDALVVNAGTHAAG